MQENLVGKTANIKISILPNFPLCMYSNLWKNIIHNWTPIRLYDVQLQMMSYSELFT